jgi:aminomethyltransferase
MDLKTPLYDRHVALGAKMISFSGYLLPVQYPAGVIAEHNATRTAAGLFDVSHMGELLFSGKDALPTLNHLLTNDLSPLREGQVRYSPMCNADGGCIDDLLVYRVGPQDYLAVVNAANRRKDADWMGRHLLGDTKMRDLSDSMAQLALQGPRAEEILHRVSGPGAIPQRRHTFVNGVRAGAADCLISRTGYTGEDGFELYLPADQAAALWDLLLEAGGELGLVPCGLGARDTLRLEAGMPLYGHELDESITPLEAGLGFAVRTDKEDFIGRQALLAPPARKRVGLAVAGRGILRGGEPVFADKTQIGVTTSGTWSPTLGRAVAQALVQTWAAQTAVESEVRGRPVQADMVALPFYKRV